MPELLDVPSDRAYQLVYRQERTEQLDVPPRPDLDFVFMTSPGPALRHGAALRRHLGLAGWFKTLLKLASGRRWFYAVFQEGQAVSTGWCSKGFCVPYRVESDAVVIGPTHTSAQVRGQGIATHALRQAINALVEAGQRLFYIDTSNGNIQSQRVIAKCDFGPPVLTYPR
jgi:predicted GNAT family acetyltransferase